MTEAATSSESPVILVVEDDQVLNEMLCELLSLEGFQVHGVFDGEAALAFVDETIPDLVLLDVMMPRLNGYEVCKELKTQQATNSVPIIMLTVQRTDEDRLEGLRVGANYYLTKPFDPDELVELVWQALEDVASKDVVQRVRFQLASKFTLIQQINTLVTRLFRQTQLSETEILELEYCLNEALVNAVEHGSKMDESKVVQVTYLLTQEFLELQIDDEGEGFDPDELPDPTAPANLFSPRGRGVFLIQNYMDEMDVQSHDDGGTRVVMRKFLKTGSDGTEEEAEGDRNTHS